MDYGNNAGAQAPKCSSPFEDLNDRFIRQNQDVEELILRLKNKLHRLSDTNVPIGQPNPSDQKSQELPFRDGQLMNYHNQLQRQYSLINELSEQVSKLENLV